MAVHDCIADAINYHLLQKSNADCFMKRHVGNKVYYYILLTGYYIALTLAISFLAIHKYNFFIYQNYFKSSIMMYY